MVGVSEIIEQSNTADEQAVAAIGGAIGLGLIGFVWFFVAVSALVIGMFLKKASIVERGPTGASGAGGGNER